MAQVGVWSTATPDSTFLYHAAAFHINLARLRVDFSHGPSSGVVAAGMLLDGCRLPGPGLLPAPNGSAFSALFDPPVRFNGYYLVTGSGPAGPMEVSWAALPPPAPSTAVGGGNRSAWVTSDAAITWLQPGSAEARFDLRELRPFWVMQNARYLAIAFGLLASSAAGAARHGAVGRRIISLVFLVLTALDAAAALGFGPTGPIMAAPGRREGCLRNWANLPEHFVVAVGLEAFESRIFAVFAVYGAIQVFHPRPAQPHRLVTPHHATPQAAHCTTITTYATTHPTTCVVGNIRHNTKHTAPTSTAAQYHSAQGIRTGHMARS